MFLSELGIALCAVTYGKAASFAGSDLLVGLRTVAKDGDGEPLRLVWDETGTVFSAFEEIIEPVPGVARQVLPQTGQSGFVVYRVTGGLIKKVAYQDWFYETTVTERPPAAGSEVRETVHRYQIPAGLTVLEIERTPATDGTLPAPVTVVVPPVSPVVARPPVSLSDGATISTDATLSNTFRVTIAGNRTLGIPAGPTDGQRAVWEVTASGGPHTLTLASGSAGAFKYGTDVTGVPAIVAGTTTFVGAEFRSVSQRWHVLAVSSGH